ncbi:MAG: hypothetical protein A2840_00505 [Candidatus Buchananbacteria bacterium RIFCSPHIGHO2_01_FULL_47_11b]|uniref:Response regulatory domain-containing protein n=1 Tax=Candidatus Buchananbacteria bacterium RIFCSPHIGHO2_01_FULL_47_11b TaxID=1797537 RepID=A0A1G1Y3K1_9BACT|nr:MAG: hypothetical protein A2840_00505 [Candidatus Buchananbacteria bacterium RIFCSPHIGHO2_01_FULL_47_11b]
MAKILLVEDEPALVKNLQLALKKHKLLVATTGADGVRRATESLPDLILLDFMLPDKTGAEVIRELKANEKTNDIPVIVLTNLSDQETVSKILAAGGREYLVKTDWSLDQLVEKIEATL